MRQLRLYMCGHAGATAVEYALLAGLLGLAIIAGATVIGQAVNNMFINQEAAVITSGSPTGS